MGWILNALDGAGAGRAHKEPCRLCDPIKDAKSEVHGSLHHFVLITADQAANWPVTASPPAILRPL